MNHFYDINHFRFFDATTIACMLPSLSLATLIFVAAFIREYGRKSFLPGPVVEAVSLNDAEHDKSSSSSTESSVRKSLLHWPAPKVLGVQFSIFVVCFLLANSVAAYCLWRFNYYQFTQGEAFSEFLMHALIPMVASLGFSIVFVLPVFWFLELVYYRRKYLSIFYNVRLRNCILASSCLFIAPLLWLVPSVQAVIVFLDLQSGDLDLLKNLFRIGTIFSLIPLAIGGLCISRDDGNIS